jgi:hypothetical protein
MSLVTQTGCNNKPRERRVISAFSCIKDGWKKKTRKISLAAAVSRTLNYTSWLQRSRLYNIWHPISGQKRKKKKNLTIIKPVRKIYLHLCVFGSRRYYEEAVLIFVFRLFLIHLCLCVWVFSADKKREPTFTWVTDGCSSLNGSLSQDQNPCPVGLLLLDNTICKSIISISILFLFKWRTKIYRFYKAFSIYENVKIGSVFIRNEFV